MTFHIVPAGECTWEWRPRFATLEAVERAMQGDYSGVEVPFKMVDNLGHQEAMLREEYKNAPYEMRIFRK